MRIILLLILIFFHTSSSTENLYSAEEVEIMRNIKCPVCNGQSIYDSNNDLSKKMRELVVKLSKEGKSKIQIEEEFVMSFGPGIVIDNSINMVYLLYVVPLLALKIIFFFLIKRFFWHKKELKKDR